MGDTKSITLPKVPIPEYIYKDVLTFCTIPSTDTIVLNDELEMLIGWRTKIPAKDGWALPGGMIIKREHPHDAVRRHVGEVGVKVYNINLIGVYPYLWEDHPQKKYDVILGYAARYGGGEIHDSDELIHCKWIKLSDSKQVLRYHYYLMVQDFERKLESDMIGRIR